MRWTLHWSPTSPYVRKVMVAAHELGLADRFDLVRATPETVVANVAADNPLGQVPTLVLPDGRVIYDSLVIVEFLDAEAGGALVPLAGPERWRVLTLHALAQGLIDAAIRRVGELRRVPAEISRGLLEMKRAEVDRVLDRLERMPLDPAQVNVATIAIGVALGYLDLRFPAEPWRPGHPALSDFHQRFSERPSMAATIPPG